MSVSTTRTLWAHSLLLAVTSCSSVFGIQDWNVPGAGSWFTASNWTPAGIPNSAETANINNSGTATATLGGPLAAFAVNAGKNGGVGHLDVANVTVNLQSSLDIGDVEATFTTNGSNVVSSGSGSFVGSAALNFGLSGLGDLNVGQTSASAGATAHGTATLTIDEVGTISVTGDMDLGQTSGDGTSTGNGSGTITNATSASVDGDLDVGQTSGTATGNNFGTGGLIVDSVAVFSIGTDVDVAQTTGAGTSTGVGTLRFTDVGALEIGDSVDVGKIRAFGNANNQANGQLTLDGSDTMIGFLAANPGSMEIGRVVVSETARGRGAGAVTLIDSTVDIANDVIVGELALGGTNAGNISNATLTLVDSKLDARDVSVAQRLDGTAGTVSGEIDLSRSLLVAQGTLSLSAQSTLKTRIDGTDRATGQGLATDYSAIDADMATLDGVLEIVAEPNYLGPAARGDQDSFLLIASPFGLSGVFDSITYNGAGMGAGFTYVGDTANGEDGLFADVTQTATSLTLATYLAIPGDANGDGAVDGQDLAIWNAFKFTSGTDWSQGDFNGDSITNGHDFLIWNRFKFTTAQQGTVPEPALHGLVFGCFAVFLRARHFIP